MMSWLRKAFVIYLVMYGSVGSQYCIPETHKTLFIKQWGWKKRALPFKHLYSCVYTPFYHLPSCFDVFLPYVCLSTLHSNFLKDCQSQWINNLCSSSNQHVSSMKNICRTKTKLRHRKRSYLVVGAFIVSGKDESEGRGWFIELHFRKKSDRKSQETVKSHNGARHLKKKKMAHNRARHWKKKKNPWEGFFGFTKFSYMLFLSPMCFPVVIRKRPKT